MALLIVGAGVVAMSQLRSNDQLPSAAEKTATVDPYVGLPRKGPVLTDHRHVPYGINLCGEWMELEGELTFPATQADGRQFVEGPAGCGDTGGFLAVIVWPDPEDAASRVIVTEQLAGTPLGADGIVMALAFTDDPTSIEMPPSVVDAEENAKIPG